MFERLKQIQVPSVLTQWHAVQKNLFFHVSLLLYAFRWFGFLAQVLTYLSLKYSAYACHKESWVVEFYL